MKKATRRIVATPPLSVLLTVALATVVGTARADDAPEADDSLSESRQTFNGEICKLDQLSATQCDCAWEFIQKKMSPRDLKLAMLLTASNSQDKEVSRKADAALDKNNASDRRKDEISSEISALTIEAEDACASR